MILYLDTSALVKVFVEETYSDSVRRAVSKARLIATHAIAYVEACAAFVRLSHTRGEEALFAALRRNLDIQWKTWEILKVTEPLIRHAVDFAERYRLRGYDSLHLAAARATLEVFSGEVPFHFVVFDAQLKSAARQADIPVLDI